MAVPDLSEFGVPLLRFAGEKNNETSTGRAVEILGKEFGLTDEDLKEMLQVAFNLPLLIELAGRLLT